MSGELYDMALSVPWCCTGEALEAMLSIAAREPLGEDEIARRMHGPKSLALRGGQRREDSRRMINIGTVARIPIDGPIYRYADFFTSMSGGITTESLARDLQTAIDDPTISGILLAIDSPGGEATGINELADAIYAARSKKPIAAYIEGYGASAAYWIASAASIVVVDDSALVGSIGTILGVPDPSKRQSQRIDIVSKQSPKKRPDVMTEEGRAVLQQIADDMTEVFIAKVVRNRAIDAEAVLAVQGGLLVGQQAIEAGLADRLGSEESTLRALALGDLALLESFPQPVFPLVSGPLAAKEHKPMAKGFWAWMGGADEAPATPPPALASEQLARIEGSAATLQPVPASAADDDRTTKVAAENAELKRQLAKVQAERIAADAQTFAKEQIARGHAHAVEQAQLVALYTQLAQDDVSSPLATADGAASAQSSRVGLLRAAVTARPANRLATNLLDPAFVANSQVLANTSGAADPYAEDAASARAYGEKANGTRRAS